MAKSTKKGQKFISKEISQLMKKGPSTGPQKGRRFSQEQAIAAAISVAKKKGYKTGKPSKDESTSVFDSTLIESERRGLFDEFVVNGVEEEDRGIVIERLARALVLSEDLVRIRTKIMGK